MTPPPTSTVLADLMGHEYTGPTLRRLARTICQELRTGERDPAFPWRRMIGYIGVYDPTAGYVTGAGWIDSPPGAYTAAPSPATTAATSPTACTSRRVAGRDRWPFSRGFATSARVLASRGRPCWK